MSFSLWKSRHGSIIVEYGIILAVLGVLGTMIVPPLYKAVQTNFRDLAAKIDAPASYTGPISPDTGEEGSGGSGDTDPPPEEDTSPEYESGSGGGSGTVPEEETPDQTEPETPPTETEDDTSSGGTPDEEEKVCFGGTSSARPAVYSEDGDTVLLSLGGDQLATYEELRAFDSEGARKVQAKKVQVLGDQRDIYLVKITNVQGAVEVMSGQVAEIIDPNGNSIISGMVLQPEWEDSLGAGDEYVLFVGYGYVMDVRSSMNGNNNYTHQDQIGHPNFGDNDGQFDFDTAGCNAPGL